MPRQYNVGDPAICEGCKKRQWMAVGYVCQVYENPKKTTGHSIGECGFNEHFKSGVVTRIRAGQQKTKRAAG